MPLIFLFCLQGKICINIALQLSWLYVSVGNEIFVSLNTLAKCPSSGYDQNRVFLGMGCLMTGRVQFELGYHMQHICGQTQDQMNHILMVGLSFLNLDVLQ